MAYLDDVGSVSIDSSNSTGNNAGEVGGAVNQEIGALHSSFTNFSNCVFINNSAAIGGEQYLLDLLKIQKFRIVAL